MSELHDIDAGAAFGELTALAYDAAAEPSLWPRFLERLGRSLDLRAANLAITYSDLQGDMTALPFAWHHDDASLTAYGEYFGRIDPHRLAAARMLRGSVCTHPELVPDHEFTRSEYYNDFYARIGLRHGATVIVHNDDERIGALCCHRGHEQRPLAPGEIRFLERLTPHLIRARDLASQISMVRSQQKIVGEVFDRLPIGIVFVDRAQRVMHMNTRAESILHEQDGLDVRKGHLVACSHEQTRTLEAIIATACDRVASRDATRSLSLRVARPSGRRHLDVMAYPIARESRVWPAERAAAFIVLSDGRSELDGAARRMRELYGLSEREAELSAALAGGVTVNEWAEQRGVSVETVRWQLKQVFAKTGVSRQPELARIVLLGPAIAR